MVFLQDLRRLGSEDLRLRRNSSCRKAQRHLGKQSIQITSITWKIMKNETMMMMMKLKIMKIREEGRRIHHHQTNRRNECSPLLRSLLVAANPHHHHHVEALLRHRLPLPSAQATAGRKEALHQTAPGIAPTHRADSSPTSTIQRGNSASSPWSSPRRWLILPFTRCLVPRSSRGLARGKQ